MGGAFKKTSFTTLIEILLEQESGLIELFLILLSTIWERIIMKFRKRLWYVKRLKYFISWLIQIKRKKKYFFNNTK